MELLNHVSPFLNSELALSFSVFLDVFRVSNPCLILSLAEMKVFQMIRCPLTHQNSAIQAPACKLLVQLIASDRKFEEMALSSDLIEIICKNALDSEFRGREQAVATICEFLQCRHSVDLINSVANAGGFEAICQTLAGASYENENAIINAIFHVLTQVPSAIDAFVNYGIMNELEEIINAPEELQNEEVLDMAMILYEQISDYLNNKKSNT